MSATEVFDKYSPLIEAELRSVLDDRSMPLYRMMTYHLGWVDAQGEPIPYSPPQRLRPTLCLMANEASGGDIAKAVAAAIAVELTYSSSLIHEDVQGGKPKRLNNDTVWWNWGPAQAINAGDGMHALARLSMFHLREQEVPIEAVVQAIRLLDEASLALFEGQYTDLSFQEQLNVGVDSYLKMVQGKAGALTGCACHLGATIAQTGDSVKEGLKAYGSNLGMMLQVREDIQAIWNEEDIDDSLVSEVLNKKKLLPLAFAFEKAEAKEKRRLGDIYFKRVLDPDDREKVAAILSDVGAREFCEETLGKLQQDALMALDTTGLDEESTRDLREMVDHLAAD